jgi:hypothetical protein
VRRPLVPASTSVRIGTATTSSPFSIPLSSTPSVATSRSSFPARAGPAPLTFTPVRLYTPTRTSRSPSRGTEIENRGVPSALLLSTTSARTRSAIRASSANDWLRYRPRTATASGSANSTIASSAAPRIERCSSVLRSRGSRTSLAGSAVVTGPA